MSLPVAANTTCDIYHTGSFPPGGSPAATGVPCFLKGDWRGGQEAGDRNSNACTWTHIMLVDVSVDIRDGYNGAEFFMQQDAIWVPDVNGTRFNVIFVERVLQGTAQEHKRVYLDRTAPTWPTNNL